MSPVRSIRPPLRRRQAISMKPSQRSWWPRILRVTKITLSVALPLGLAGWVAASPAFRNLDFEVVGVDRVAPLWVEEQLGGLTESHLLAVEREDLDLLLLNHPWIESVALAKRLPNHLRVEIEERRPVALWRKAESLSYLDRNGYPIAAYDASVGGLDLPMVGWKNRPPVPVNLAKEIAQCLETVERSWAEEVSEYEILGGEDVRVTTGALPFPLLLNRDSAPRALTVFRHNLLHLERLFPHIAVLDLRFEGRMILRYREIKKMDRYFELPELERPEGVS